MEALAGDKKRSGEGEREGSRVLPGEKRTLGENGSRVLAKLLKPAVEARSACSPPSCFSFAPALSAAAGCAGGPGGGPPSSGNSHSASACSIRWLMSACNSAKLRFPH